METIPSPMRRWRVHGHWLWWLTSFAFKGNSWRLKMSFLANFLWSTLQVCKVFRYFENKIIILKIYRNLLDPQYYVHILSSHEGHSSIPTQEISKDIQRSFPEHPFYHTEVCFPKFFSLWIQIEIHLKSVRRSLERVWIAYSWRNPLVFFIFFVVFLCVNSLIQIGYCQGMNFIVAQLLLFMSEEVWLFCYLLIFILFPSLSLLIWIVNILSSQ